MKKIPRDKKKILDTSKKRKKENELHEKIKNQNGIRFLNRNNDIKSQGNDAFKILRAVISNLYPTELWAECVVINKHSHMC